MNPAKNIHCPLTGTDECPAKKYQMQCPERDNGECPLYEPIAATSFGKKIKSWELIKILIPTLLVVIFVLISAYFQLNFLPRNEAEITYVRKETYNIQLLNIQQMLSNLESSLKDYNNTLRELKNGQDSIRSEVMLIKGRLSNNDK